MFTTHRYQRREKLFSEGRLLPLDRNAKARIMTLARALSHRTEKGKHYGVVTAKFIAVLEALLWGFHNAASGRCFPSYERIAERAHCARSTVYEAIHALERVGILTWVNRIARIREWGPDLFGRAQNRWRVIRTSNAYTFVDPAARPGVPKTPALPGARSSKSDASSGPMQHRRTRCQSDAYPAPACFKEKGSTSNFLQFDAGAAGVIVVCS
jgi:Helix-turn-helix domain